MENIRKLDETNTSRSSFEDLAMMIWSLQNISEETVHFIATSLI
jgi:hypothetical protein